MEAEGRLISGATGVVLAGGRSSRFGTNKALALLEGRPLIQHATDCLQNLFSLCLVSANQPDAYAFLGLPVIRDRHPDQGPLSGIHAALSAAATPWVFVTACDLPRQNPLLIRYLWSLTEEPPGSPSGSPPGGPSAVLPCAQRGPEPLYGFYHRRILPVVERRLQTRQNRLRDLLAEIEPRLVTMAEMPAGCDDPATFHNVNRPAELEALARGGAGQGEDQIR